jgi:pimeloyl-ACP methyl ester carboxylesterase
VPAAVLIAGSGAHGRDEFVAGHRPFLVLADFLSRKGIAVLRYDKRGAGRSRGNYAVATTADFATDAEAAAQYLRTRPEIDPHKIGLIGHSEGGVIAPAVAAQDRDIGFVVMLAGSGVPGDEVLVEQTRRISETSGVPHQQADQNAAQEREILNIVKSKTDPSVTDKRLREALASKIPDAQVGAQIEQINSPWFRYFVNYDPAIALRQLKCPVLALNGEKDVQVSAKQNLPVIRRALEQGGNSKFEVDELRGLNHLFQSAITGAVGEYTEIEETMSPIVLDKVGDWIAKEETVASARR